jgi:hypothetical protein
MMSPKQQLQTNKSGLLIGKIYNKTTVFHFLEIHHAKFQFWNSNLKPDLFSSTFRHLVLLGSYFWTLQLYSSHLLKIE